MESKSEEVVLEKSPKESKDKLEAEEVKQNDEVNEDKTDKQQSTSSAPKSIMKKTGSLTLESPPSVEPALGVGTKRGKQ